MPTALSAYPRPPHDTGLGLHDATSVGSIPFGGNYRQMEDWARAMRVSGISHYKVLADGTNKVDMVRALAAAGIMPVIRLYAERPHPDFVPHPGWVAPYVAAGGRYFEFGNEPNIGGPEWEDDEFPDTARFGELIGRQWTRGVRQIRDEGGIPLFFAMTPGGHYDHRLALQSTLSFLQRAGHLGSFEGSGIAIHPRPHTFPPQMPYSNAATVTFDEWRWIANLFKTYLGWNPPMFATEHGYSLGDSTNTGHPPIDAMRWTDYNRQLFEMMNPTHPRALPDYFFGLHYWVETEGGTWANDNMFGQRFPGDPQSWGNTFLAMNVDWERRLNVVPVPPVDPTPPSGLPPRELVDLPTEQEGFAVVVETPNLAPGTRFWYAQKIERQRGDMNQGRHHIYSMTPHNPNIQTLVEWQGGQANISHDKPTNEPAANFAMFGGIYDASIYQIGISSETVTGMRLPQNQHESYYITWILATKPGDEPPPDPEPPTQTLEERAWQEMAKVELPITPVFALPSALLGENKRLGDNGKGYDISTPEHEFTHDGVVYVMLGGRNYWTNARIIELAKKGDWNNVLTYRRPVAPDVVVRHLASVHQSSRQGQKVKYIIVHSTDSPIGTSLERTATYLRQNADKVSIHRLVGISDGQRISYHMVEDAMAAHHCEAASARLPDNGPNSLNNERTWGIEGFQVKGKPMGAEVQELVLAEVVDACQRMGIPWQNVLGHREIDPIRRSDPVGIDMNEFRGKVRARLQ